MKSPVLFLVFNRPEPTRVVFETLRRVKPSRLYVAADGPRPDKPGEQERCLDTRQIIKEVDWPCEVRELFRERNLGCKYAVSGAVEWFFQQEAEGIILEDDCVPDETFFRFCDELLERYRDEPAVGLITGDNFQFGRKRSEASYYFSRYAHIWGWASWRRAWAHYDVELRDWPRFLASKGLERQFGRRRREVGYWRKVLDEVYEGAIDTWDYQLTFMLWAHRMLSIVPEVNLVRNIGFGAGATHTQKVTKFSEIASAPMSFPLQHPAMMSRNAQADDFTNSEMFARSLCTRLVDRFRATLSG